MFRNRGRTGASSLTGIAKYEQDLKARKLDQNSLTPRTANIDQTAFQAAAASVAGLYGSKDTTAANKNTATSSRNTTAKTPQQNTHTPVKKKRHSISGIIGYPRSGSSSSSTNRPHNSNVVTSSPAAKPKKLAVAQTSSPAVGSRSDVKTPVTDLTADHVLPQPLNKNFSFHSLSNPNGHEPINMGANTTNAAAVPLSGLRGTRENELSDPHLNNDLLLALQHPDAAGAEKKLLPNPEISRENSPNKSVTKKQSDGIFGGDNTDVHGAGIGAGGQRLNEQDPYKEQYLAQNPSPPTEHQHAYHALTDNAYALQQPAIIQGDECLLNTGTVPRDNLASSSAAAALHERSQPGGDRFLDSNEQNLADHSAAAALREPNYHNGTPLAKEQEDSLAAHSANAALHEPLDDKTSYKFLTNDENRLAGQSAGAALYPRSKSGSPVKAANDLSADATNIEHLVPSLNARDHHNNTVGASDANNDSNTSPSARTNGRKGFSFADSRFIRSKNQKHLGSQGQAGPANKPAKTKKDKILGTTGTAIGATSGAAAGAAVGNRNTNSNSTSTRAPTSKLNSAGLPATKHSNIGNEPDDQTIAVARKAALSSVNKDGDQPGQKVDLGAGLEMPWTEIQKIAQNRINPVLSDIDNNIKRQHELDIEKENQRIEKQRQKEKEKETERARKAERAKEKEVEKAERAKEKEAEKAENARVLGAQEKAKKSREEEAGADTGAAVVAAPTSETAPIATGDSSETKNAGNNKKRFSFFRRSKKKRDSKTATEVPTEGASKSQEGIAATKANSTAPKRDDAENFTTGSNKNRSPENLPAAGNEDDVALPILDSAKSRNEKTLDPSSSAAGASSVNPEVPQSAHNAGVTDSGSLAQKAFNDKKVANSTDNVNAGLASIGIAAGATNAAETVGLGDGAKDKTSAAPEIYLTAPVGETSASGELVPDSSGTAKHQNDDIHTPLKEDVIKEGLARDSFESGNLPGQSHIGTGAVASELAPDSPDSYQNAKHHDDLHNTAAGKDAPLKSRASAKSAKTFDDIANETAEGTVANPEHQPPYHVDAVPMVDSPNAASEDPVAKADSGAVQPTSKDLAAASRDDVSSVYDPVSPSNDTFTREDKPVAAVGVLRTANAYEAPNAHGATDATKDESELNQKVPGKKLFSLSGTPANQLQDSSSPAANRVSNAPLNAKTDRVLDNTAVNTAILPLNDQSNTAINDKCVSFGDAKQKSDKNPTVGAAGTSQAHISSEETGDETVVLADTTNGTLEDLVKQNDLLMERLDSHETDTANAENSNLETVHILGHHDDANRNTLVLDTIQVSAEDAKKLAAGSPVEYDTSKLEHQETLEKAKLAGLDAEVGEHGKSNTVGSGSASNSFANNPNLETIHILGQYDANNPDSLVLDTIKISPEDAEKLSVGDIVEYSDSKFQQSLGDSSSSVYLDTESHFRKSNEASHEDNIGSNSAAVQEIPVILESHEEVVASARSDREGNNFIILPTSDADATLKGSNSVYLVDQKKKLIDTEHEILDNEEKELAEQKADLTRRRSTIEEQAVLRAKQKSLKERRKSLVDESISLQREEEREEEGTASRKRPSSSAITSTSNEGISNAVTNTTNNDQETHSPVALVTDLNTKSGNTTADESTKTSPDKVAFENSGDVKDFGSDHERPTEVGSINSSGVGSHNGKLTFSASTPLYKRVLAAGSLHSSKGDPSMRSLLSKEGVISSKQPSAANSIYDVIPRDGQPKTSVDAAGAGTVTNAAIGRGAGVGADPSAAGKPATITEEKKTSSAKGLDSAAVGGNSSSGGSTGVGATNGGTATEGAGRRRSSRLSKIMHNILKSRNNSNAAESSEKGNSAAAPAF